MSRITSFCFILLIFLTACRPQTAYVDVTRLMEVTVEITQPGATPVIPTPQTTVLEVTRMIIATPAPRPALGSPEHPIRLLFPANVPAGVVGARAELLTDYFNQATGLNYQVEQPAGYDAMLGELCAAPEETIAFMSALAYVLANDLCDVQAAEASLRLELPWQMGMIVARTDSNFETIADLAGKRWAVPTVNSPTTDLYFQALFSQNGIEIGQRIIAEGDNNALLAVFNGQADFATATFTPPLLPNLAREWVYGQDDPELWRALGLAPIRHPIGYVIVLEDPEDGGYRIRDARAALFDSEPEIFSQTEIVALSAPIPNDTIAFGSRFPVALAWQLMELLTQFAASEECRQSICSADFLAWEGLEPTNHAAYEPLQTMIETLQLPQNQVLEIIGQ